MSQLFRMVLSALLRVVEKINLPAIVNGPRRTCADDGMRLVVSKTVEWVLCPVFSRVNLCFGVANAMEVPPSKTLAQMATSEHLPVLTDHDHAACKCLKMVQDSPVTTLKPSPSFA